MDTIAKLTSLGQSLWLDNIQRKMLENGELKAMIERGDIRGMTSNPTIFNNAISKTREYDSALIPLAWAGWDAEKIFWELAVEDIRDACDAFLPLYEESNGGDGFVSIEVSPDIAYDTDGAVAQAEQLWVRVARPNLMVKIPATKDGIPAIRKSIAAGLNINITLIFSLKRYAEVMDAYLSGLEERAAAGLPINHIASVASFFVSRVDTKIDPKLPKDSPLLGKAAIANARMAYEEFHKTFVGRRWENLKVKGARVQRPLWASTSTKNPAYADTMYADSLIGPETVDTVPPQTLEAIRDHGKAEITITRDLEQAQKDIEQLEAAGISMDVITQELEDEGIRAFAEAFKELIGTIEERRRAAVSSLGPLAGSVSKRIEKLEKDLVPARLWQHDPTLWSNDPSGQAEVAIRLGWLDSVQDARTRLQGYESFSKEIHNEGIDRVLVLGMGGSSLTAEVFSSLLTGANIDAKLSLAILDSTDPHQVLQAARFYPPEKTLYIVASKSGGTAEVTAAFDYFWELSKGEGSRFIAITDPGTSLETLAKDRGFRRIFSSDPHVGGRFSALTDFGLVPAALLGMDINKLLTMAAWMKRQSTELVPPARNPGMTLGAVIAEGAFAGRDKLTVLADTAVFSLANWIEQVIAESSGKDGKGILPVALEPLDSPEVYGQDRLFIYLRQNGELDNGVSALKHAGFPVIEFPISNPYDAGAEFFRWEVAVSVACHTLGVNAFDQPDVQDSKNRTKAKIAEYQKTGRLAETDLVDLASGRDQIEKFLAQAKAGDFVAINAYLPRNKETVNSMQLLRVGIREKTKCAVPAGFGPRFQHSTGQFHKGGPNKGLFLQVVYDAKEDVDIPTEGLSFGTLLRAQALGDYEALEAAGRRVIRIRVSTMNEFRTLAQLFAVQQE
jgi:transaldolase/glucose-6-phosphate isomerase